MTYVVTETVGPDSFDPKDADKTQNLLVMRMLYATPLEVDKDNLLKSSVLKAFHYDELAARATFELREGKRFSDGTPITIQDVALAVARSAYFHPEFPVLKNIRGVKTWANAKNGLRSLPEGLKVSGNALLIEFEQKLMNPLFRFCLEIFSIIPASCIDLDTATMTCKQPAASGYYNIRSRTDTEIIFKKRDDVVAPVDDLHTDQVSFKFLSLSEACRATIQDQTVIAGSETDFLSSDCARSVSTQQLHWMPSARFSVLRFNPNISVFSTAENRRFFAESVRQILRSRNQNLTVERSLFPKLLPGYLSESEFPPVPEMAMEFKGSKIAVPRLSGALGLAYEAISQAAEKLGMSVEVVPQISSKELVDNFVAGRFAVIAGGSGFWAQDPVGDVSMWFTKNLHKTMTFVWNDEELYRQIGALENETDATLLKQRMEALNRHIDQTSLIAPILHFRRLFVSSPNVRGLNLPQAVTSPAPWQLIVIR
ncbi:MAG: ABC transporter substrate-binding protein [Bdellovibrionaceae bacterium]|nr:ABC transporter substrate-binding protein [Pseudobdellovibrionaceae bacterium]